MNITAVRKKMESLYFTIKSPLQNWLFWYPPMHSAEFCIFLSTTYLWIIYGSIVPDTARTVAATCRATATPSEAIQLQCHR
jgi:hypothetical protein